VKHTRSRKHANVGLQEGQWKRTINVKSSRIPRLSFHDGKHWGDSSRRAPRCRNAPPRRHARCEERRRRQHNPPPARPERRRGLTSRSAPAPRGSPCPPAWWCSGRSPARHEAPSLYPGPLPGWAPGGPGPTHPLALLGGAVQPRHHLAVQQQEQGLVRHLRSALPLPDARRAGAPSASGAAGRGLRGSPRRGRPAAAGWRRPKPLLRRERAFDVIAFQSPLPRSGAGAGGEGGEGSAFRAPPAHSPSVFLPLGHGSGLRASGFAPASPLERHRLPGGEEPRRPPASRERPVTGSHSRHAESRLARPEPRRPGLPAGGPRAAAQPLVTSPPIGSPGAAASVVKWWLAPARAACVLSCRPHRERAK